MTQESNDRVWQSADLVQHFLAGVRAAIPLAKEQIEVMLRLLEAIGRPVERFLDLGCGDGVLGSAILQAFPDARGVFADFSEPMLQAARQRLAGKAAQIQVIQADFGAPGWAAALGDQRFDAVVSGFAIHHQPDVRKRELYNEMFGLLNSGGMFLNVEHVASASAWLSEQHDQNFIDSLCSFHQRQGSALSREEVAREYYYRQDKVANILTPIEEQCRWLREVGFADVDCYMKIFEIAVFGGRRRA
jgi:ubiquinone/menaquinone biosynthesis C-methylase UbiE